MEKVTVKDIKELIKDFCIRIGLFGCEPFVIDKANEAAKELLSALMEEMEIPQQIKASSPMEELYLLLEKLDKNTELTGRAKEVFQEILKSYSRDGYLSLGEGR
jgi:hypothetical protein